MATKFTDVFLQHNRLSEWVAAGALIGFALVLMTDGNSFTQSTPWGGFARMGATEVGIAVPLAVVGAMRIIALWANGSWRRSPLLRAIGAVAGFTCFSLLAVTALSPWVTGKANTLSTGVVPYTAFAVLDLIAAYRAGADVGANKRAGARGLAMVREGAGLYDTRSDGGVEGREERATRARRQAPAVRHEPVFVSRRSQPEQEARRTI